MITSRQHKRIYEILVRNGKITLEELRSMYATTSALREGINHFIDMGIVEMTEYHGIFKWTGKRDNETDNKLGLLK